MLFLITLSACTQSGSGIGLATPLAPTPFISSTAAVQTVELLTATPEGKTPSTQAATEQTPASSAFPEPERTANLPAGVWVEIRDSKYGFGLAVPCWWPVSPIPAEGYGGTMTLHSYDEAYFLANSTKGWWTGGDWPDGAVKVDVSIWEGFDPSLTTLEAFKTSFDPSASEIVQVSDRRVGENSALLVEMRNLVNLNDSNSRLFILRLSSSALLMVSAAPDRALDSSDFQAMLGSLALSPDQPVNMPAFAPSPAIIPLPAACPGG